MKFNLIYIINLILSLINLNLHRMYGCCDLIGRVISIKRRNFVTLGKA